MRGRGANTWAHVPPAQSPKESESLLEEAILSLEGPMGHLDCEWGGVGWGGSGAESAPGGSLSLEHESG